jgi:hypothetical protein
MTFCTGKIDAAADQLDWAIKLFLDHKAYVPAITLAGAAEEIIGEMLGSESAFQVLKERLSKNVGLSAEIISQAHLNKAKNWLKHWKEMKDSELIDLELEKEASQYILRAITNLYVHDQSCTSETPRFAEWVKDNIEYLQKSS